MYGSEGELGVQGGLIRPPWPRFVRALFGFLSPLLGFPCPACPPTTHRGPGLCVGLGLQSEDAVCVMIHRSKMQVLSVKNFGDALRFLSLHEARNLHDLAVLRAQTSAQTAPERFSLRSLCLPCRPTQAHTVCGHVLGFCTLSAPVPVCSPRRTRRRETNPTILWGGFTDRSTRVNHGTRW